MLKYWYIERGLLIYGLALWFIRESSYSALFIATFLAFFRLKVILWWEKYKDNSSTLKDDSLSELYSPTQSMSVVRFALC